MSTINYIVNHSSFHYYGLWDRQMMQIQKDGTLLSLEENEIYTDEFSFFFQAHGQSGSKSAQDTSLFFVEDESNLVYIDRVGTPVLNRDVSMGLNYSYKIKFNMKSIKHVTSVMEALYSYHGAKLLKISVLVEDTFILSMESSEIDEMLAETFSEGVTYDFTEREVVFPVEEDSSSNLPLIDIEKDELPF